MKPALTSSTLVGHPTYFRASFLVYLAKASFTQNVLGKLCRQSMNLEISLRKFLLVIMANFPEIIAFVNQKGGVGKSTGAVHAADRFARKGKKVILIDADAQQSSSQWVAELNETHPELKLSAQAIVDPEDLFDKLQKLTAECDLVVVDGPAKSNEITKAILARCQLALIPCRESIVELRSSGDVLRLIRQVRELRGDMPKAAIFLTQVKNGTVLLREAREALGEDPDIPLMKTIIYDRQVFKDAPGQATTVFGMPGKPAKEAAGLYDSLFNEALKIFNG